MRKITQQIKQAFERRESKTIGNTTTDGNTVWLHGNDSATHPDGLVLGSLAGWNTPTTRERVNGITGLGFHQKNFEPM
jgi:hypothetical protein